MFLQDNGVHLSLVAVGRWPLTHARSSNSVAARAWRDPGPGTAHTGFVVLGSKAHDLLSDASKGTATQCEQAKKRQLSCNRWIWPLNTGYSRGNDTGSPLNYSCFLSAVDLWLDFILSGTIILVALDSLLVMDRWGLIDVEPSYQITLSITGAAPVDQQPFRGSGTTSS